ncbi:hypothetical protein ABID21_003987 [Pseudorhizobium tarimense]|uniref:Mu-like prophage FluMu N-terminal domain-containing protein n=1 Tax=Pseudorhizobium tarimense TaxID=1079109 RepID=A0ABV2HBD6_9HYPH|nr:hypothetical protein [Pseudorhizobium tarimense]MCJ8520760.1 hypothetical protein [Pseudorhizobium tarimense]
MAEGKRKLVKVEVTQAFRRYKVGDTPMLTAHEAKALEQQGMVKAATQAAEKQTAKVAAPGAV